ncbi:MAG: hypothetical protein J1E63_01910 [Muribaculaceae bacterium]|nr:hypothetical protein [Muribaculaceae bacterium]
MGSRRHINYQWRLFLTIMTLMVIVMGTLFGYHIYQERELRTDLVHSQLTAINSRIIKAYEQNVDLSEYMTFLKRFYDNSMFDELRVSIYNINDSAIYNIGDVIPVDIQQHDYTSDPSRQGETGSARLNASGNDASTLYYLSQVKSNDGLITVFTAMPVTVSIVDALTLNPEIWYIIAALMLLMTIVTYYSTRFLTRNILIMRDFARRAASGEPIDTNYDFPHDELGDISREIVALYNDRIGAMTRSNRERAVAINAINDKERIKRQLTNNINHELKTPIGVIGGYIDTILSDPDMDPALRTRFLRNAQTNIERLRSLMDDVSTMTRLEENGDAIPLAEVDFHDMVYKIAADLDAAQIANGMTFVYDVPMGCRVYANETLLHSILMNLIRNAGIHSHGTTISLSIISESATQFSFSFTDDGNGVPDEALPHLFERFYRVDSGRSRKVGGTGLGLSIVKNAINAMGGTISVHNRSTGGLEFIFTLIKWEGRDRARRKSPII